MSVLYWRNYLASNLCPERLLPRWAKLYGIPVSPMMSYCTRVPPNDKLPRGMDKRLPSLRKEILLKIAPPVRGM